MNACYLGLSGECGDCRACGSQRPDPPISAMAAACSYSLGRDVTRCIGCGNCNTIIPGLDIAMTSHRLIISATNFAANRDQINQAVVVCPVEALTIKSNN